MKSGVSKTKLILLILLSQSICIKAPADSRILSLEQKIARCDLVAKVQISETKIIRGKKERYELDMAICKAKVTQVFKGSHDLREVEFRFAYFETTKLPNVGEERFAFIFLDRLEDRRTGYRVIEGSLGLVAMSKNYLEYRSKNASSEGHYENLSLDNFVTAIREVVAEQARDSEATKK